MGVCLSKEHQLQCTQCNQPLIDLGKSTKLWDTMSSPACHMRRFSLDTPRFSAEIGEMVGALLYKAIPKPFDTGLCGWSSETLLPSPQTFRNCSSARKSKRSFTFCSNRPSARQKRDVMSHAVKACREARINACTHDCCISGEENVSITYNQMMGSGRRIQSSIHELESDAASSDGISDDEMGMPGPTNSPERDWAAISTPPFHRTRNCSHQLSMEDGEERKVSDHYPVAHATPETGACKGHGRRKSVWALSAGEEFFTDWEMGGETAATADRATRARAASDEIAVFNAEDYFKEDAVEEITSANAELDESSCEYVATAISASASCTAENCQVALSSYLDGCHSDPCSEKPCCMQAEEVSLLGSARSTLSASKSSQNSESTSKSRSKRQRCRQLIEGIKMLKTEAHQFFAIKHADHASRMPCFSNLTGSTSGSKPACKKAKRSAVKTQINAHVEESPHCKQFLQVDQTGEVVHLNRDLFSFCKLAAGSDADDADAFVAKPSHAKLSAPQKRRFPASPSILDAVHAFGSPLTVLGNSTDRETYEDGEDSDSSSDLFEIESLTTGHLISACPLSKREEEEVEKNITIPSLPKFAVSLAHSKPLLESIKKTNVLRLSDRPLQLKETTAAKYQRKPRGGSLDCIPEDHKTDKNIHMDAGRSIPYAENEPPGPIPLLKVSQHLELLVEERSISHSSAGSGSSGRRQVLGRLLKQTNDDTFYPNGLS